MIVAREFRVDAVGEGMLQLAAAHQRAAIMLDRGTVSFGCSWRGLG